MSASSSSKQRILSAIRGEKTDHVPFSPFLAYWWEDQSQEFRAQGQFPFMQSIGADPLLRGFHSMFDLEFKGCEVSEKIVGEKKYVEHRTPHGTLYSEYTYVESGNTWFLTKHPIETLEQLEIFKTLIDSAKITPNDRMYAATTDNGKNDLLLVPTIGMFAKSAFQTLLEHWIGTENLIYMLYDYEDKVMDLLKLMWAKDAETVEASLKSPAEAFIFWEDSSTTNINPDIFRQCTAPEISDWAKRIHREDKLLIHHACGHLKDLLIPMAETGIDAIESLSPPPTGNITIKEAFTVLPDDVAIIGGIEPVFLLNCTLSELEIYVHDLLAAAKGRRFVLANSDSCPPGVSIEKFRLIADIAKNFKP